MASSKISGQGESTKCVRESKSILLPDLIATSIHYPCTVTKARFAFYHGPVMPQEF